MTREEIADLILASQEGMYRVAKTLLRSDADCADAISETIVKAFSKIHTLREDAYAKTWLMRILMNECYALLRRQKRIVSIEDHTVRDDVKLQTDYSQLYEALMQLPQEMRICVTLYYLEGYSVKETAAILEVSQSAVKIRLMRARRRLRAELKDSAVWN